MDPVTDCKGKPCYRPADCITHESCLYKSSAEEAREAAAILRNVQDRWTTTGEVQVVTMKSHLEQPVKEVKDFEGKIDGAGIKAVMLRPKNPLELITPEILEGLAGVLLHGAQKYSANNWMRGMSWETVMGGVLRHLTAFRRGEEIDPESGLPHLHHATCGLMFLSWYANGPQRAQHEAFDDRGYKC